MDRPRDLVNSGLESAQGVEAAAMFVFGISGWLSTSLKCPLARVSIESQEHPLLMGNFHVHGPCSS